MRDQPGSRPTSRTPGIKDVASVTGVSVGTVSNVLNRPEALSESTRQRVRAAIEELGFVRNDSARQLRARRSRTLCYVILDAANPFFADVQRGVTRPPIDPSLPLFGSSYLQGAGWAIPVGHER